MLALIYQMVASRWQAFELAEKGNLGMEIQTSDPAKLFGEDQARYLIACNLIKLSYFLLMQKKLK